MSLEDLIMKLTPSADYTEIGYLEFYQKRQTLAPGTYQVTEADGDITYAVLSNTVSSSGSLTEWYSEVEYRVAVAEAEDLSKGLYDSWDQNRNSELFDREVYGIEVEEVDDGDIEDDDVRMESISELLGTTDNKSFADLLREEMSRNE